MRVATRTAMFGVVLMWQNSVVIRVTFVTGIASSRPHRSCSWANVMSALPVTSSRISPRKSYRRWPGFIPLRRAALTNPPMAPPEPSLAKLSMSAGIRFSMYWLLTPSAANMANMLPMLVPVTRRMLSG